MGLSGKANSIKVGFADDGREDNDTTGSGLDAASVTPSAFTVGGSTVSSVLVVGNAVYLTLEENLASDERPSVSIGSGLIMDKAGNAFGGARINKANDRLGPVLDLSEDADLSNEKITVTITTDEQLGRRSGSDAQSRDRQRRRDRRAYGDGLRREPKPRMSTKCGQSPRLAVLRWTSRMSLAPPWMRPGALVL